MNIPVKTLIAVSAIAALSGCVAVPVGGGYYEPAPAVVYVPPPVVYAPRPYYGPSVSFGFYGGYGRGGYGHGHRHRGRGHH